MQYFLSSFGSEDAMTKDGGTALRVIVCAIGKKSIAVTLSRGRNSRLVGLRRIVNSNANNVI